MRTKAIAPLVEGLYSTSINVGFDPQYSVKPFVVVLVCHPGTGEVEAAIVEFKVIFSHLFF